MITDKNDFRLIENFVFTQTKRLGTYFLFIVIIISFYSYYISIKPYMQYRHYKKLNDCRNDVDLIKDSFLKLKKNYENSYLKKVENEQSKITNSPNFQELLEYIRENYKSDKQYTREQDELILNTQKAIIIFESVISKHDTTGNLQFLLRLEKGIRLLKGKRVEIIYQNIYGKLNLEENKKNNKIFDKNGAFLLRDSFIDNFSEFVRDIINLYDKDIYYLKFQYIDDNNLESYNEIVRYTSYLPTVNKISDLDLLNDYIKKQINDINSEVLSNKIYIPFAQQPVEKILLIIFAIPAIIYLVIMITLCYRNVIDYMIINNAELSYSNKIDFLGKMILSYTVFFSKEVYDFDTKFYIILRKCLRIMFFHFVEIIYTIIFSSYLYIFINNLIENKNSIEDYFIIIVFVLFVTLIFAGLNKIYKNYILKFEELINK